MGPGPLALPVIRALVIRLTEHLKYAHNANSKATVKQHVVTAITT